MADETNITGTAQLDPATAQDGQVQPPAQAAVAAPASTAQTKPAPDVEKELQKLRSEQGRIAAQARRAEEAAAQLRQQNRTLQMRDMSDVERLQFERDEAYQFANATQQQLADQERERARQEDLQRIASLTGAPLESLQDAQSPHDAWERAVNHLKATTPAAQAQQQERTEANAVYLGGGAPSTPNSRHEQALRQAVADGDPIAYVRLLREGKKAK
jgi:hypothetical protein